jgi:mono/diheme cytochrome c family protein
VKVPNDPAGYASFYNERKVGGHTFYPEVIFKDTVAFLVIFAVLAVLAAIVGAPTEPKADPTVVNYIPRPEWYFLFLFQFLRLLKPQWEIVGTTVLPLAGILILLLLPWLDYTRYRHPLNRPIVCGIATLTVTGLIFLSVQGALAPAPESAPVTRLEIPALSPIEQQGRQVYQQYACSVCHAVNGLGGGARGPDLAGVGVRLEPQQILAHLQPVTSTTTSTALMPSYVIPNPDVLALTAYLLSLTQAPFPPITPTVTLSRGEGLYLAGGCPACHTIDGVGGTIGPDLSSEGAKHDAAWLVDYLQNPTVVLPGSRMPAHPLPQADTQQVAEYLAGLKGGPQVVSVALGQNVYDNQGCAVCHMVQGKGGTVGPDLTRVGDRLNAQQIAQYVHDPKTANPATAMPPYGNLSDVQLQSLAQYLLSLSGKVPSTLPLTPPAGTVSAAMTSGAAVTISPPPTASAATSATVTSAATVTSTASSAASAATVWATRCAGCHGDKGQGGAVVQRPIRTAGSSDDELRTIIAQGRGRMPAFGTRVSAAEIDGLIALLRAWQAPAAGPAATPPVTATVATTATMPAAGPAATTPVTTTAASGASLWATNCAACHGDKGQGGAVFKRAIDLSNQTDAKVQTLLQQGRGTMPPFDGRLSAGDIGQLIALMRSWSPATAVTTTASVTSTVPVTATTPPSTASEAVTTTAPVTSTAPTSATTASAANGAAVWAANCLGCHGDQGQGGAVAKEAIRVGRRSDDQLRTVIQQGRDGMPGFGTKLGAADVDALIALLRSWSGATPAAPAATVTATEAITPAVTEAVTTTAPVTSTAPTSATTTSAANGAVVWAANCLGCHGDKGQGGAVAKEALDISNRTDAQVQALLQQGRDGMPGFATKLSTDDVAALIALMRTWKP